MGPLTPIPKDYLRDCRKTGFCEADGKCTRPVASGICIWPKRRSSKWVFLPRKGHCPGIQRRTNSVQFGHGVRRAESDEEVLKVDPTNEKALKNLQGMEQKERIQARRTQLCPNPVHTTRIDYGPFRKAFLVQNPNRLASLFPPSVSF